ncbi:T9SS type A sorting domain-containing protein [Pontimicrobium aquaticum]|uniref:T9SS type A sorting domain-containing protein n=1 Tax=Pontimicrobium aquaticum TaxID=2565367 RepID=A0A4U0F179_9FLAO|nr:T9SS type A sorting domain-containing protein [Pontimicrobium aquaticum]TJY38133.1 T9SS type A sorting domain-containing protein [Pontimicrobium aquaticum]
MKYNITFILLFGVLYFSYGQTIFSNEITDTDPSADNPYTNNQYVDANITVSGIGRGSNITRVQNPYRENKYAAYNWSEVFHEDDYLEFVLTPDPGKQINFNNFIYTGVVEGIYGQIPTNISIRSSVDSLASDIGTPTLVGYNYIDLSAPEYQNITSAITFRIYAWGGDPLGIFGLERFEFNGSVEDIPCYGGTTYTWESGQWNSVNPSGTPTLNDPVIINDNYNSTTNGSFSTCNLTVNNSYTLTIANNTYVEVENDIVVNGSIIVQPKGSVVQINDNSSVTNNGNITVNKETAPANKWYEYTYWSSPVENETIGGALSDADIGRRFWYNAENYLDATMETNNNNTSETGQDDIDDDGNDWVYANAADTMIPGVGYASTHDQVAFNFSPGNQFVYSFHGAFNNGEITVPVYRNDSETNDNNWNFIGNPYPSAIDADVFLTTNSIIATNIPHHNLTLDGALFLWSQNTVPSDTANGNQNLNFASSDYAVINAVGEIAGGDGVTPTRYIPSGQGFFVVYSDDATPDTTVNDISRGTVVFNNSMRVTDNNDQFFRTTHNTKMNKLWLNLTSDNGVFKQILVAYVQNATDDDDGMAYDTPRNLSSNAAAILYSTIENNTKKFVIQGKAINSIDKDEVISIGYKTSIDVPTIYSISIAQLEGGFLTNNAVYLKDNLLNKLHNLKVSDYNFTSNVGEFNDRFEIVFSQDALSLNEQLIGSNQLSIIEHANGNVQFKLNASNSMTNIKIIDLQGRILYNFDVSNNDETLSLSNLSGAPYIAKITLDNNVIINKKAIKRY